LERIPVRAETDLSGQMEYALSGFGLRPARHGAPRESTVMLNERRPAVVVFALFLLLVFVGLSPFQPRDPALFGPGATALRSAGDLLRQISYGSIFLLLLAFAIGERGRSLLADFSPLLAALLVWCLASALWSTEPDVVFRRAALTSIIAVSTLAGVSAVGSGRSIELLKSVLGLVLIVNWLSIAVLPQAVHLPGDVEPLLVGDWRGLYFHKNIAGSVSAITALIFLFSAWKTRRLSEAALGVAAVLFTVMTHSRLSLALFAPALAVGTLYRLAWSRPLDRAIVTVGLALLTFALLAGAIVYRDAILQFVDDPAQFTGRTEIWTAELAAARDRPWFGIGYGAFADTGAASPLHHYVASRWIDSVAQGHNAYLQLLVTIGLPGLLLAIGCVLVEPALSLVAARGAAVERYALPCALFVFMLFHNFLESDFLEGDSPAWVAWLVMLGVLREKAP
jgi:O-antigen ligase